MAEAWRRRTPRGVRGLKYFMLYDNPSLSSRTPRGVRGLKFPVIDGMWKQHEVAPLAGCVD